MKILRINELRKSLKIRIHQPLISSIKMYYKAGTKINRYLNSGKQAMRNGLTLLKHIKMPRSTYQVLAIIRMTSKYLIN